ncbi:hypothetical protein F2Q68_00013393 [Brassica cretica]|uniref:THH1/TOM1/TOM3 domain-containing protein n=1 Tax=Brassica cretica TaxID=69181 RepID=A0A8S9HQL7_BRACR|nr:hypothetical protein F2Q68_00013393 [Brassica cretica]
MHSLSSPSSAASLNLKEGTNWWWDVNESPVWQDRIFHLLAVLYAVVSVIAVIQLVRIQLRVPEYGWTTQKVFHFLNFLVNGVRALVFVFRRDAQNMQPELVEILPSSLVLFILRKLPPKRGITQYHPIQ